MIRQLTIKNLAIIDDITIDFDENLNVLTGETGAGKSIIIDAISLIFGARANSEIVAHGKESAFIQVALELNNNVAKYINDNYDIDVLDECIITRTINVNGKSSCKINGVVVPLYLINEISPLLIDISSQNESQYLFNHKNHLALLDSYIENKEPGFKDKYISAYKEYLSIKSKIDDLNATTMDADQLEFLNFKFNELKDYNYSEEDEQAINAEYRNMVDISQHAAAFEDIVNYLDNDTTGANKQLYNAIKLLGRLTNNEKLNEYYEKFNSLYLDIEDLTESFKADFATDSFDANRFDYLQNEITKINRFKRKYNTLDVLAYKNKLKDEIDKLNNKEIELSKLEKELKVVTNKATLEATNIHAIREKYALELSKLVKNELNDLYLIDAEFSIHINKVNDLTKNGNDDVEFYMTTNKGIPEMPLIKVASGGEVSRIMLGLKAVFTRLALVDIIIFDEIDTGVSGKVALAMGKKMEKIAKSSQVLAITHLPQVAAMSDHHYYIYKVTENDKTRTIVNHLTDKEKVNEVARLLSGDCITDNFIKAAKELISLK